MASKGQPGRGAFLTSRNVSRETIDRLDTYAALLDKWSRKINLVAPSTLDALWTRHFEDSAQLFDLAPDRTGLNWVDLGSGGGFPGLIVAALAADAGRDWSFTLVESDTRKCVFLMTAAREMGLDVAVKTERIESVPPLQADILSARALASLDQLLDFAERHRKPEGICLFPKGAQHERELTEAGARWHSSVTTIPSTTDPRAVILRIGEFHRV
ncbi:16S rRNA (guanine(527)-N(7))-methyltransferase RsmG [Oceanomicrobium pacificus]|uniref:Ribosomal RNA small subunit methyltransferase G n=1 Tax=Oceanomicrobium pacificus TaxID=2692916 RepID=A0A6B0U0Q9_9RHOB|nr:16S rRNA (guanine(527)-N(7))-methyltransferase RsmG [Oceanomicrobium pacificus]MXU64711.1 16S rRNA (guanine(527)-N(7))-methyltransferase RsmG [Oceanomicrobium pacificus]